jgi:protein subunit release factor A
LAVAATSYINEKWIQEPVFMKQEVRMQHFRRGDSLDPATGAEMRSFAGDELRAVRVRLFVLEQDLRIALLPKEAADDVRGGAIVGHGAAA